jgi:hypothetical protein
MRPLRLLLVPFLAVYGAPILESRKRAFLTVVQDSGAALGAAVLRQSIKVKRGG